MGISRSIKMSSSFSRFQALYALKRHFDLEILNKTHTKTMPYYYYKSNTIPNDLNIKNQYLMNIQKLIDAKVKMNSMQNCNVLNGNTMKECASVTIQSATIVEDEGDGEDLKSILNEYVEKDPKQVLMELKEQEKRKKLSDAVAEGVFETEIDVESIHIDEIDELIDNARLKYGLGRFSGDGWGRVSFETKAGMKEGTKKKISFGTYRILNENERVQIDPSYVVKTEEGQEQEMETKELTKLEKFELQRERRLVLVGKLNPNDNQLRNNVYFEHDLENVEWLDPVMQGAISKIPLYSTRGKSGMLMRTKYRSEEARIESEKLDELAENMFMVFKLHRMYYTARVDDALYMEKIEGDVNSIVEFNEVALVGTPKWSVLGNPVVWNAKVVALIEEQSRSERIYRIKFRKRKGLRKKRGHRQFLTRLRIMKLVYEQPKKEFLVQDPLIFGRGIPYFIPDFVESTEDKDDEQNSEEEHNEVV
mmetsp:Transcript_5446/g.9596  ORF Transcript_5446/g.9596 Transcript_5446/m.9596 type:complete len:478 (-) Transcript_5446:129-1562(-)